MGEFFRYPSLAAYMAVSAALIPWSYVIHDWYGLAGLVLFLPLLVVMVLLHGMTVKPHEYAGLAYGWAVSAYLLWGALFKDLRLFAALATVMAGICLIYCIATYLRPRPVSD